MPRGDGARGGGGIARRYVTIGLACAASWVVALVGAAGASALPGAAWGWGSNGSGQLGNGQTAVTSAVPTVAISAPGAGPLNGIDELRGGAGHTVALTSTGTVLAWGSNSNGQLGNGTTTGSTTPVQVTGGATLTSTLQNVVQVAAGGDHSLALIGGHVYAWGANASGQLGNNSLADSPTPVEVLTANGVPLSGVIDIAAGLNFSMALTTSGNVYTWGDNSAGELGNTGAGTQSPIAVEVAINGVPLAGITAIAAGQDFALALTSTGGVDAWGDGTSGQLGNGASASSRSPVVVQAGAVGTVGGPLSGITAIAAGGAHALALIGGGTVAAWGQDGFGQLGNNQSSNAPAPVQVLGPGGAAPLSGITQIAAGLDHSLAMAAGGQVDAWGRGDSGQLGNNSTSPELTATPVQLTPPAQALGIGCCENSSIVITQPDPVVTAVSPASGPAAGGTTVTITGNGFTGANIVTFGTTAALFTVVSDTQITATAPGGTGGLVDVAVAGPGGTSATSAADQFGYESTPDVTGGGQTPATTPTTATFAATLVPNGLATSVYFEYGLDPSEVAGGGAQQYPFKTSAQALAGGFTADTVTQTATGLQPGATYHERLVATNSSGTTLGPDVTFTTLIGPPPPPPVQGKSVNLAPVSGHVFVELPGTKTFVPLTAAIQVPVGAIVDATHGKVTLTSAKTKRKHGGTQSARFYDGEFKVGQKRGAADTTLTLKGGVSCAHRAGDTLGAGVSVAVAAKRKPPHKPTRKLWGDGHGSFTTKGTYASAAVLGTIWLTQDYCDGTLVRVVRDSVKVKDFVTGKTVTVHQGHSFFAASKR